jgi:hypothetical protein
LRALGAGGAVAALRGFRAERRKAMTVSTPTMPTQEELQALWTALANFRDEMLRPVALRIHGVVNEGGSVTFENIGVLLTESHECRDMLRDIEGEFERLEDAARADMSFLARDGELGSVPRYDELGEPNYVHQEGKTFLTDQAIKKYFPATPERPSDA